MSSGLPLKSGHARRSQAANFKRRWRIISGLRGGNLSGQKAAFKIGRTALDLAFNSITGTSRRSHHLRSVAFDLAALAAGNRVEAVTDITSSGYGKRRFEPCRSQGYSVSQGDRSRAGQSRGACLRANERSDRSTRGVPLKAGSSFRWFACNRNRAHRRVQTLPTFTLRTIPKLLDN
jgi:hypothetical protein